MHMADSFIQSDIQYIQAVSYQFVVSFLPSQFDKPHALTDSVCAMQTLNGKHTKDSNSH